MSISPASPCLHSRKSYTTRAPATSETKAATAPPTKKPVTSKDLAADEAFFESLDVAVAVNGWIEVWVGAVTVTTTRVAATEAAEAAEAAETDAATAAEETEATEATEAEEEDAIEAASV